MNRIFSRYVLFLSVVGSCALSLSPTTVYADKALEIKQALASKKAASAVLAEKAKILNSEVASLKRDLIGVSKTLRASEEKLSEADLNLMNLRQKKDVYLRNLSKSRSTMDSLVSAARKYSQTSTSHMLVKTKPIDAARAAIAMKSIMPVIRQQSAYLQSQLTEIGKIEGDIAEQMQLQTQQSDKLNRQQAALAALLEERNKVYQSTESRRQEQEKEVAALVKESRDLEELMANLKSKSKNGVKTAHALLPPNILLPVHGAVHTGFGEKDDFGAESKGITFLPRPGAGVIIPLAGIVKFAGAFQNYKQILIVEHQGGYHSLIGGLARIDTVVGASLAAGEPVGMAKTSGAPQIYYELRQNGKPVNPQKLLIAQRKQEKS